ncbi:P-type conjugative transfer protein TrbL [Massilia niabensis]|uniref:P-type conjugative transfer protein TrbL n=1 Tax=Massilia niabensis TaxID=544910 RepID=A0ABW0L4U3_9BURK
MKPLSLESVALTLFLVFYGSTAAAAVDPNDGVLDVVIAAFSSRASAWQSVVMNAASWLFWTLGTVSFAWTMGMLALRKADVQEFFSEFVKFSLFFGFFYWLLKNGPAFADSIIKSLRQIGDDAAGTAGLSPSSIVDVGFRVWTQAVDNLTIWEPVDSFIGIVLSLGVLVLLALTAINMLLLLISAWILMYAGIFFLGFGGSRWTSDLAVNYFKTVLGVAIQLFGMILLIGIGIDLLNSFFGQMAKGTPNFKELGVMLTFCLALLVLSSKIPSMLAGVLTGSGIGGVGTMTAGGVVGASMGVAAVTGAAVATAGAALAAGAANVAGGAQALMAAISNARASEGAGASSLGAAISRQLEALNAGSGSPLASAMGGAGLVASSEIGSTLSSTSAKSGGAEQGGAAGTEFDARSKTHAEAVDGGSPGEVERGSMLTVAGAVAAKASRVAAGTVSNLALGSLEVAKSKLGDIKDSALERIGDTTGGRIATAIESRSFRIKPPSFDVDNLSAEREPTDRKSEVAAFRDR